MTDDHIHVDTDELRKLGTTFESHAYDLGRHLSAFRRRTDTEALRERLGGATASHAELAELTETVGQVIGQLRERLDEIADGLKSGALNTEIAEDEISALLGGVR